MSNAYYQTPVVYNEDPMRRIRLITEMDRMETRTLIHYPTNTHYDIYPAMKKFPATSAIMIKTLFGRFILSSGFKQTKNRELFSTWAKGAMLNLRRLYPLTTDGFTSFTGKMNAILRLAKNGHLATYECLSQYRKLLAWIELTIIGIICPDTKSKVMSLIDDVNDRVFDMVYSNVVKTCHNGDCMNVCRTQCPCRETRYCSAACQNADWKRHKKYCGFVRK